MFIALFKYFIWWIFKCVTSSYFITKSDYIESWIYSFSKIKLRIYSFIIFRILYVSKVFSFTPSDLKFSPSNRNYGDKRWAFDAHLRYINFSVKRNILTNGVLPCSTFNLFRTCISLLLKGNITYTHIRKIVSRRFRSLAYLRALHKTISGFLCIISE